MDHKEILELWLTIWKQETMLLESNGKLVGFTLMENYLNLITSSTIKN